MALRFSSVSEKVVANSRYLATIYEKWGTRVDAVIYPPIDCQSFKPVAKSPRGDYAVTYFGKETNFRVIQNALNNGIKIKAFGGKIATAPKRTLNHPNLEFLGRVSDSQLVELYSNASFTFFPFIDEPFGYIPVESMACGTPVITFGKQGPGETVVNKVTGWLAENEDELVKIASKIWKEGYPRGIRDNCRRKSLMFDVGSIAQQWLDKIDT
jgi:glycosyltransferase involved in cell wall biosynthesis